MSKGKAPPGDVYSFNRASPILTHLGKNTCSRKGREGGEGFKQKRPSRSFARHQFCFESKPDRHGFSLSKDLLLHLSLAILLICSGQNAFSEDSAPSRDEREGQALALDLRNAAPEKDSEIRGVLKIRSTKQKITNDVPVLCKIVAGKKNWETIYETAQTSLNPAEQLIVRHFPDKPNQYFYARAESPGAALPKPKELCGNEAVIPLANSDFSLADLGLEFLHWPQQRRLKGEMRLGQACYVLESVNPAGKEIVRVKSFIDKDTGGILIAEAFDVKGKTVKEFTLSGSSFKKVNGQWQLQKMTIENVRTKSRTILEFDLSKTEQP